MRYDPELIKLLGLLETFVGSSASTIGGATTMANTGSFPVPLGDPLRAVSASKSRNRKRRRKPKQTEV